MRTTISLAGVLLVAAVAAVLVRGQPERPAAPATGRTITVIGTGTAVGKPDSARVHLGVTASAKTAAEGRGQVTKAVRQVRESLAALNLPNARTRFTDSVVVKRTAKDDPATVLGYEVQQSFAVRLTDADPDRLAAAAQRVLDAGLANGTNALGGVEFFRADDTALRRQAKQRAVEDALAAAQAYATGAKLTVVEVVSIDGTSDGVYGGTVGNSVNPFGGMAEGQAAPAVALSAGDWEVSSSVRVVCRY